LITELLSAGHEITEQRNLELELNKTIDQLEKDIKEKNRIILNQVKNC